MAIIAERRPKSASGVRKGKLLVIGNTSLKIVG
jgi:hypothetical protein